ncbi:hypothetical protein ACJX0J_014313, partial [Zea mays]
PLDLRQISGIWTLRLLHFPKYNSKGIYIMYTYFIWLKNEEEEELATTAADIIDNIYKKMMSNHTAADIIVAGLVPDGVEEHNAAAAVLTGARGSKEENACLLAYSFKFVLLTNTNPFFFSWKKLTTIKTKRYFNDDKAPVFMVQRKFEAIFNMGYYLSSIGIVPHCLSIVNGLKQDERHFFQLQASDMINSLKVLKIHLA